MLDIRFRPSACDKGENAGPPPQILEELASGVGDLVRIHASCSTITSFTRCFKVGSTFQQAAQ